MSLTVTLGDQVYNLNTAEGFMDKLEECCLPLSQVIKELQNNEEEIAAIETNEEFLFVGTSYSYVGFKREEEIQLHRLIPSENVL